MNSLYKDSKSLSFSSLTLLSSGGYTNCVNGKFDATICPNVTACAANCILEGADYSTYGVSTEGNALSLNLFVQKSNVTTLSSTSVYLLANESTYDFFQLLNQESTFDVDVSYVPRGINVALYFLTTSPTGVRMN